MKNSFQKAALERKNFPRLVKFLITPTFLALSQISDMNRKTPLVSALPQFDLNTSLSCFKDTSPINDFIKINDFILLEQNEIYINQTKALETSQLLD